MKLPKWTSRAELAELTKMAKRMRRNVACVRSTGKTWRNRHTIKREIAGRKKETFAAHLVAMSAKLKILRLETAKRETGLRRMEAEAIRKWKAVMR